MFLIPVSRAYCKSVVDFIFVIHSKVKVDLMKLRLIKILKQLSFLLSEHFFKLGFTPCKAEQPLRCKELQEKKAQKD